MLRTSLLAVALLLATPALAQTYEGNWACRSATGTAGILTIYGSSYGFASPVFGDPASGTGTVEGYTDGVAFADGQLRTTLGVEAGRLVTVDSGTAMQLETGSAIAMLCMPL